MKIFVNPKFHGPVPTYGIMENPNLVPNAVTDFRKKNFQNQKQNHVKRKILMIFTVIYQNL